MTKSTKVLEYLADVASLGGGSVNVLDENRPCWYLSFEQLSLGALDIQTTQEILTHYSGMHKGVGFGECEVPVIACLARLVPDCDSQSAGEPLLLLPGLLMADGKIRLRDAEPAWIPLDRLARDGVFNEALTVSDIDAYRAHQIAMATLPDDGSWSNAATRAMELFTAIKTIDDDLLARLSCRIETSECLLLICELQDGLIASGKMLRERLDAENQSRPAAGRSTLDHVLALDEASNRPHAKNAEHSPSEDEQGGEDVTSEGAVSSAPSHPDRLYVSSMPGDIGSLTPSERDTISTFARQSDGESMVVRTPVGTSSLRTALAVMGQAMTDNALRGDDAPVLLCSAPRATLMALSRLIDERPLAGQTSLSSRWLPRVSYESHTEDGKEAPQRRTLGPITSILMHHVAGDAGPYDGGRRLTQPLGHSAEGAGATYSDAWYAPKATTYYLDCVSGFMGQRPRDVRDAYNRLSERLRIIDQDRSELLVAYEEVCRAAELIHKRDELVAQLGRLRREHSALRKRLSIWERLSRRYPAKKSLVGRMGPEQQEVIANHILDDEVLAQGRQSLEEIRVAYTEEVERIESEIDRLRGQSASLSRDVSSASTDGKRCLTAIEKLVLNCRLSIEQASLLESMIDGRDSTTRDLDEVLDVTVRPAEFWISLHIYEARWLELCELYHANVRAEVQKGLDSLQKLANLCPIHLVEDTLVPSLLERLSRDEPNDVPIDLVIVLEAQDVSVPTGLAILNKAKRAVVMGSEGKICAPSLFGSISDELYASKSISGDLWGTIAHRDLVSSGSASLFTVMLKSPVVKSRALTMVDDVYGELVDFRCDLVPSEPVGTLRVPSNFADDPSYALARIVPALSYVLVPDSAWEPVGSSRQNVAEALAILRWLQIRMERISERYQNPDRHLVLIATAHKAQALLIRELVAHHDVLSIAPIEVRALDEVGDETWPLVLLSATCGPESYVGRQGCSSAATLCTAASAASDALIAFCGGAWVDSANEGATILMKRARLMGRLFSVARKPRKATDENDNAQVKVECFEPKLQPQPEDDVRVKPLSLTRLLKRIELHGGYEFIPTTHEVNIALSRVGLIKRYADGASHTGWRPTASGREIGIVPTVDRVGNPFCSYAPSAEPVVVNIVESLLAAKQHDEEGRQDVKPSDLR